MVAEVRYGVETIDHIAIPVRALAANRSFYVDVLGLKHKTARRHSDGTARGTCVTAGANAIVLHLPGVAAGASPSPAPRVGIGVSAELWARVLRNLEASHCIFRGPIEHGEEEPLERSIYFDDPDGNHLEVCVRRREPFGECISHVVFETREIKKAITFYAESLGAGVPLSCGSETMIPVRNGQMIGLVEVAELSERSMTHHRGCYMAMDVPHADFDSMVALIKHYGGRTQGDHPTLKRLGPEGERSIYFFDPDNNRLQIVAPRPERKDELPSDREKWRRLLASRTEQAPGVNRWEAGGKKFL